MKKWAYDLDDEELLKRLVDAAARAGASNSGGIIDITAGSNLRHSQYLASVMRARLEQAGLPPYRPGQQVVAIEGVQDWRRPPVEKGETCTVECVWYEEGEWQLELKGKRYHEHLHSLYAASKFAAE